MSRFLIPAGTGLVGAIAAAVILIALTPSADVCKEPKHHCIVVSVDSSTNTINLDAYELRKHGAGHIRWSIDNIPPQTFEFPANGIVFKGAGADVFKCKPGSSRLLFECSDTGKVGTWEYTVTVTGGSPKDPKPLDPIIINN